MQYTQLIARRLRDPLVYCEIHASRGANAIRAFRPKGIVLSGRPAASSPRTARAPTAPATIEWE